MSKRIYMVFLFPLALVASLGFFPAPGLRRYAAEADTSLVFRVPVNFPKPVYNAGQNPVTPAGFALGKMLFYDPGLSADKTVSCGNCHQASAAFANLGSPVSTGVKQCKGTRNAPALFNLAWQKEFMWDGRINNLHAVPTNALTNPCEMGTTMPKVLTVLRMNATYVPLFKQAFGSPNITADRVLEALAQFTAMLISANARYDKVMRHEPGVAFTAEEQAGYVLFRQKCSSCHPEPLFTDRSYRNNGLDEASADRGRDSLTHLGADLAKFRVPSLRNVEITGPYMHDGRFYSLKQVLKHYSEGMKKHVNLDAVFVQKNKQGIALSATEQGQIIAFLKTLTDVDFINDRRFNNN